MTTNAERNGRAQSSPGELHPDLRAPSAQTVKIQPDKKGSSGRTLNSGEANSSLTERGSFWDRFDGLVDALRSYWVPPRWLVQAPPGWSELTEFALHRQQLNGAPALVIFLNRLWLAVALAASGKARIREWVLTRFWRAVVFVGVPVLFLKTTPLGAWIADYLIRPYFHALAWIFLP